MTKLSSRAALLLTILSFAAAGCAEEPQAPAGAVVEEASEGDETTVSADEELKGGISFTALGAKKPGAKAGLTVIETKAEYEAFFGAKPPASVDFTKHWVIHTSVGVKSSGGYATTVKSVKRVGKGSATTLVVDTKDVSPGPGCMVTQALTNPQATVRINKQPGVKLAKVVRSHVQTDCSDPHFCAAALCLTGTTCDELTDSCVQNPDNPYFCAVTLCAQGTTCDELTDRCVQDPNDSFCARVRCAAGTTCNKAARQCVDDDGDPCNPSPCGAGQTCSVAYPSCAPPPDGLPSQSCRPQAVCEDKPKDQCSSDQDCAKGLHCQPEFVCIKAPCNARLVCR